MPIDKSQQVAPYHEIPIPQSAKVFEQNGRDVYVRVRDPKNGVPPLIHQTVEKAHLLPRHIAAVVVHQGSLHMVEALEKQLPEYEGKFIHDYAQGNWSSGSILKGLKKAIDEGRVGKGDFVVMAGFGAGLFSATSVIQL